MVGAAGSGGSSGYLGGNGYAGKVALTYTASSTPNNVVVRFLLSVPSTGATNGAVLVKTVISSGTLGRTEVYYGTGGKLGFRGYTLSSGGSLVFDSGLIAFGVDGTPVMISGELAVSGGNINWAINGIQPGSTLISVTGNTGSFAGTIGAASQVVVNPGGTVNDTAIGHVVVQYGFEALTAVSNALSGHAGERAADRFTRLLTEEGVGYQLVGTNTDTPLMGPQTDQPILALLQECEDADRGILYEPRGQFGIAYRTRVNLQNQTAALALDYTAGHISNMTPTDDDQLTRNDVTISRVNGASAREYLASGALSVQAPPNGVGAYVYTATVNLNTDSQCDPEAQWVLAVGTVDEERYPLVEINLARTQLTSVLASAAALNCGDYFTITNQPAWLPSGTVKQLAWGFTETITYPRVWEIQINAVPESPYEGTGLPTW